MDFDSYYKKQALDKLPSYQGASCQRGYGFGDVFKRFFKWIVPVLKKNAVPIAKKVGKSALKTAVNIASDGLEGQDLKTSAKNRIKESIINFTNQSGKGYKRKHRGVIPDHFKINKKLPKKKKIAKRRLDIFDSIKQ